MGILKTSGLKPNIDNSRLVGSLKKQLKELKENIRMKDEELNKYKKSIKFTKIREIQAKNKVLTIILKKYRLKIKIITMKQLD